MTTAVLRRRGEVYAAFVRNAFLNMLAYRTRYFTGIVTYLMFASVYYFIWQAVFAGHESGATIKGFTLPQMVTYVCVGWIARSLYFSNIDWEMNELFRTGQISVYLLRPVNFHWMMLSQASGESLFRLLFFTIPIGVVILSIFPVAPPASLLSFFLFLFSTGIAFLILAEINFLTGLMVFSLKSILGVMRAKYFLIQLFSGLLLPLSFFPEWAQWVLKVLPFQYIAYVPLNFYLGRFTLASVPGVLAMQLMWVLVLVLLGRYFWSRAFAKLTLQGG